MASPTFEVEILLGNELLEHIRLPASQTRPALVNDLQGDAVRRPLQVAVFCQVLQDFPFGHAFEDFITIHVFFTFDSSLGSFSANPLLYTATREHASRHFRFRSRRKKKAGA